MYSRMGRTKDALSELEQELKINPRLVKALVEQGNILSRAGSLDDAMKSFVKAMEINPHMQRLPDLIKTLTEKVEGRDI